VLAGVVTTVDALTGMATLDRQPEAVKQAAVADRLILTKTDLGDEQVASLRQRLRALNPAAPVIMAVQGAIDAADVLHDRDLYDLGHKSAQAQAWLTVGELGHGPDVGGEGHAHAIGQRHDPNRHDAAISCFAIVREKPFPAVALTLLLEILAEHCGADLLRMKGILQIAENPDKPAVVHGVQHVFHPPVWLEAWPSADRRSRLVFIGRNLSRRWIEGAIAAIEAEVADVGATQLSVPG
jgi:G3E family GTPase